MFDKVCYRERGFNSMPNRRGLLGREQSVSMSMRMRSGLAVVLLCLAASGGRAQKAETQFDRSTDFSRYKTYAWREYNLLTQQNQQNEKLIEHSLVEAVNARL